MKNIIEKARIAALVISLIGGAFKFLHWPGGSFLLLIGLSSLSLCHIIRVRFNNNLKGKERIIHYLSNFGIAALVIGVLFTLMHWQGAQPIVTVGVIGWALSYAFDFFMPAENNNQ